jgi:hypothetical protein
MNIEGIAASEARNPQIYNPSSRAIKKIGETDQAIVHAASLIDWGKSSDLSLDLLINPPEDNQERWARVFEILDAIQ